MIDKKILASTEGHEDTRAEGQWKCGRIKR